MQIRKSQVVIDGKKAVIVHDKLLADGPCDPETGEPLINPETQQPYDGKNDDMGNLLHEYLVDLRNYITLSDGQDVLRYGVLSILSESTPIFLYDHPRLKEVTNTAFTDGHGVFIDADFFRKLREQEEATGGKKSGIMFLILHELLHKLLCHVDRLEGFPPDIANKAEDLVINGKLIMSYKNLDPVALLEEVGVGMKKEDAQKYYTMPEEVVAEMLWNAARKKANKSDDSKQKSNGGGGSSGGGSSGSQSGESEEEESEYSGIHHIDPEDFARIIQEEGLENVAEALNMPSPDDEEGLENWAERNNMQIVDSIQLSASQSRLNPGEYPGAHITDYAEHLISKLQKGKLAHKLLMRKHIMGEGQRIKQTDEEADIFWFLKKEVMGIKPFYSGAYLPHAPDEAVYIIIDTSGSTMGGTMRREFLEESVSMAESTAYSDAARKVFIQCADTTLRGEPTLVTRENINQLRHDGVPVLGDGGTCFKNVLVEGLKQPVLMKENIKVVFYFTDCGDAVPRKEDFEEYIKKGMKFVFITTPGMYNAKWDEELDWAELAVIEEGVVIDANAPLDKTKNQHRKNKRR